MANRLVEQAQDELSVGGRLWPLVVAAIIIAAGMAIGALVGILQPLLAIIVVAAILGTAVLLRSAVIGLFALIGVACLLPFGAIPLGIGFNPTFLDLALLAVFGVTAFRLLAGSDEHFVGSPLDLLIVVFLVLAVFSFVAGLGHAGISKEVLRHFAEVLLSIVFYFVVTNSVRNRSDLATVTLGFVLFGFTAAAIGIVLYILPQEVTVRLLSSLRVFNYPSGENVLRFIEDNPNLPMRATSTSVDPNVLGGLLILVTSITTPQFFTKRPLLPRTLTAPMLGAMGICMILTLSRGAVLGLGVALMFLGVVRYRWLLIALIVTGTIFLVLPQTQGYIERFQQGIMGLDLATQMRFGEYRDALNLIARYPVFGVGFAGVPSIDLYIGVSSVYLLMAEEMGLVGLGMFGIILLVFFWSAFRNWSAVTSDERLEPIFLGLLAAIVGALVGGVFDHYFFNLDFPHSVALFWLCVGLTMAAVRLGQSEDARR